MTAPWASTYVGIPYRFAGRDRAGCDCWGLVRLVLAERFARGEIDAETYRSMRAELESNP